MSSLKDNLLLKTESFKVSLAETGFSLGGFWRGFPAGKKVLLAVLLLAFLPLVVGVRLGAQWWAQQQAHSGLVTAHPAYGSAQAPEVSAVTLFNSNHGWYSAYARITNENLDLAAPSVAYHFDFFDSGGQVAATSTGSLYLLPNQQKYVVVSRVDSRQNLSRAELVVGDIQWQKRLTIPEVALKASAPFLSNEPNPLTLVAEGAVVNSSPYELGAVRLVSLLCDKNNRVVGVSQRDEFSIPAFGRRAYKQTWPDLLAADIARSVVLSDTNTLDNNNLISGR